MENAQNTARQFAVGSTTVGDGSLLWILGPCVLEAEDVTMRVAETLAREAMKQGRRVVFKASYSKANRLSASSYAGPGLDEGLRTLEKVR